MSLWEKTKATAKRTKLQGEIALLEREIKNRKLTFGVELYDLLIADPKSFGGTFAGVVSGNVASVIHLQHEELSIPFESCKSDIYDMEAQQQSNKTEQDHLAYQRESGGPATTAGEHLSKAGTWMSTSAKELQLSAKTKMIDRDIRRRKEQFGLEAYESFLAKGLNNDSSSSSRKGLGDGIRGKVAAAVSQNSPKEKKIQECLDRSHNAVAMLERQKGLCQREIDDLNQIIQKTSA